MASITYTVSIRYTIDDCAELVYEKHCTPERAAELKRMIEGYEDIASYTAILE